MPTGTGHEIKSMFSSPANVNLLKRSTWQPFFDGMSWFFAACLLGDCWVSAARSWCA